MKPKLLLILLTRRHNEGFAIAFALTIGVMMLLMGVVIMVRSQQDQNFASAQQTTAEGISTAEVGIARFQELLNKNRYIALYPDCVNVRNSSGVCSDINTNQSWATASTISNISICGVTSDLTAISAIAINGGWQNVDSRDASKGQYRLIDYEYRPDTGKTIGQAPGTGILTLEGRVKQNNDISVATSRIVVNIPIEEGNPESDPIPGVWLTNGGTGGNTIEGDVLLGDCSTATTAINTTGTDPETGNAYAAKHTNLEFPDLPPKPSTAPLTLTGQNYTFPRVGDTAVRKTVDGQNVQVYEYVINSIDLQSGNHKVTITPGQRVTFYLNGNISKGSEILHNCTGNTNCKPTNFQIYGYAPKAADPTICVSGSDRLEAFIFAPNYTVGVAGAGSSGGIKGSVWADSWSNNRGCGSETSNTAVVQTARWSEIGLVPKNAPPTLKSLSAWQRLERD